MSPRDKQTLKYTISQLFQRCTSLATLAACHTNTFPPTATATRLPPSTAATARTEPACGGSAPTCVPVNSTTHVPQGLTGLIALWYVPTQGTASRMEVAGAYPA
jgi:hypothetical protein